MSYRDYLTSKHDFSRVGGVSFRNGDDGRYYFTAGAWSVDGPGDTHLVGYVEVDARSVVNGEPVQNRETQNALQQLLDQLWNDGWDTLPVPPGSRWYYRRFSRR